METTGTPTPWLSREDIDRVANALSADDLIEGMTEDKGKGLQMLKVAFNRAAIREGLGEEATTRISATDFKHFADTMGGVINVESPLSNGTQDSLDSVAIGG